MTPQQPEDLLRRLIALADEDRLTEARNFEIVESNGLLELVEDVRRLLEHEETPIAIPDALQEAHSEQGIREIVDTLSADEMADLLAYLEYRLNRRPVQVLAGMGGYHINGNPHDNSPENLRLVPVRENRKGE